MSTDAVVARLVWWDCTAAECAVEWAEPVDQRQQWTEDLLDCQARTGNANFPGWPVTCPNCAAPMHLREGEEDACVCWQSAPHTCPLHDPLWRRIAALETALVEARGILAELEWIAMGSTEDQDACPMCGGRPSHTADCPLDGVLSRLDALAGEHETDPELPMER